MYRILRTLHSIRCVLCNDYSFRSVAMLLLHVPHSTSHAYYTRMMRIYILHTLHPTWSILCEYYTLRMTYTTCSKYNICMMCISCAAHSASYMCDTSYVHTASHAYYIRTAHLHGGYYLIITRYVWHMHASDSPLHAYYALILYTYEVYIMYRLLHITWTLADVYIICDIFYSCVTYCTCYIYDTCDISHITLLWRATCSLHLTLLPSLLIQMRLPHCGLVGRVPYQCGGHAWC